MVRVGRYGPYLERDGQRVNVPEDMAPDELTPKKAEELFSQPSGERVLGADPGTGHALVAKAGRFGPYVTEQLPEDAPASAKPRTASLLKSMALDTVTLEDALKLLSLPRVLGELDGETITVQNGRYGPYVKQGSDSRSLESEDQLFTLTLAEAKELFAQPKARGRGARQAAPPLRELGADPASGKPMVIKDGRFGPYVTDGETNASLRRATRSRRSPTSGPPSCSPTGAPRRRHRAAGPRPGPPRPGPPQPGPPRHARRRAPRPVRHRKDLDFQVGRGQGRPAAELKTRSRTNQLCGHQCRYAYAVNFRAGENQRGADRGHLGRGAARRQHAREPGVLRSSPSGGCGSRCPCPVSATGSVSSRSPCWRPRWPPVAWPPRARPSAPCGW